MRGVDKNGRVLGEGAGENLTTLLTGLQPRFAISRCQTEALFELGGSPQRPRQQPIGRARRPKASPGQAVRSAWSENGPVPATSDENGPVPATSDQHREAESRANFYRTPGCRRIGKSDNAQCNVGHLSISVAACDHSTADMTAGGCRGAATERIGRPPIGEM